jgi:hypothetical protein
MKTCFWNHEEQEIRFYVLSLFYVEYGMKKSSDPNLRDWQILESGSGTRDKNILDPQHCYT